MDNDFFRDAILGVNTLLACFLFFVHLKNRRTQVATFNLTRSTHRSGINDLVYIGSEQVGDNVLCRFVFFNPGSVAAIIQSFSAFETPQSYGWIRKSFERFKWRRIKFATWWPTSCPEEKEERFFSDEYMSLYVADYRVIMVLLPGLIDRRRYLFRIDSNHGYVTTEVGIDGNKSCFPYAHFRKHYD